MSAAVVFKSMLGSTISEIEHGKPGDEEIIFKTKDGRKFRFYHSQGCCESVEIEDVTGELTDLIDSPLLQAESITDTTTPLPAKYEHTDSYTWTFYKFTTVKGAVTIRWLGTSNGYYSEEVDFEETTT